MRPYFYRQMKEKVENVDGKMNIRQTLLLWMLTLAFWGILYPEFSLGRDVYVKYNEAAVRLQQDPQQDFWEILEGDSENIVIKSKLWEWLKSGH